MKRTILFKAKRLDNGKWVKGNLVKSPLGTQIVRWEDSIEYIDYVDPSTVCQFTGLKDKDGKEVWEHDILQYNYEVFEVVFKDGSFSISYWGGEEPLASFFVKDDITLMVFTNLGSKFYRKEGEK